MAKHDSLEAQISWLDHYSDAAEKVLGSRAFVLSVIVLLIAVVSLFAYAAYGYASSACYDDMRGIGLDEEANELFDTANEVLTGLRKGTASTPKWNNGEFQDEIKDAIRALAEGRDALQNQDGLAALAALEGIEKSLSHAKRQATNRVNELLRRRDPSDPNAFEKYRLEGKGLVATVKQIDAALETLGERTGKPSGMCNW